jgi:hypothetical protein
MPLTDAVVACVVALATAAVIWKALYLPPIPKPEPRATTKARRQRQQAKADRAVYAAVSERDGWQCRACGSAWALERHHITYRSRGGATDANNVCCLCRPCHHDAHAGRLVIVGDADGVLKIRRAA